MLDDAMCLSNVEGDILLSFLTSTVIMYAQEEHDTVRISHRISQYLLGITKISILFWTGSLYVSICFGIFIAYQRHMLRVDWCKTINVMVRWRIVFVALGGHFLWLDQKIKYHPSPRLCLLFFIDLNSGLIARKWKTTILYHKHDT